MKLQWTGLIAILLLSFGIQGQQKLTMEEAVLGQMRQFAPQTISQLSWMGDSDSYAYVKDNTVMFGKLKGKTQDTKLFSLEELNTWKGGNAMKSIPQLHWTGMQKFTFEEGASFYEADLKSNTVKSLGKHPDDAENVDRHEKSNHIAFTKGNDLYVMINGQDIQVTKNEKDIVSGQIISRNEYGIEKGTFWNPEGNMLAFYQKNEAEVTNYPLINYNTVPATVKEIKYPMAGGKSEHVSIGVYDVSTKKTIFLQPKEGGDNDHFYLTNISWSPDGKTIYVAWMNRGTTDMKFIAFDAASGKEMNTLFTEHDDKYVEPLVAAVFVPGHNDQFIWISQRDGFNNLYLYDTNGKLLANSKAAFDIIELLGFDPKGEHAFVIATGEIPTEKMCFKIRLSDMSITPVSQAHGSHTAKISGSGMYVIDQFSNLTTPNKIDIIGTDGRLVKNLLNAPNPYEGKLVGQTEIFAIKAADGSDLWCRLIKPSNFDPAKKYPVVVYLYNGPHVQLVTNSYLGGSALWMNYLAEEGYLVFTLDGHGSDNRGKKFEQVVHRKLGDQEIEDQLLGTEWLKKQAYVDGSRMAIHGWSYGGFMTTSMMLRKPGTFKVGVAGGPVIDWSMYEVMYGERYMDTPQENPDGYKNSDLTQYVKNLKGDLLMIHGVDDNVVVMQHNMKFLKACVDNKVQVDFFAYPGHEHNVRGKDRVHLMTKVIDYITERL